MKKFKVNSTQHVVDITKPLPSDNQIEYYNHVVNDLVHMFTDSSEPYHKIGVVIRNSLQPERPIGLSYRYISQFCAEAFWEVILRVNQSNSKFLLEGILTADVNIIELPRGKGRNRNKLVDILDFCKSSRGIINVQNEGTDCLARALYIAMCLIHEMADVKNIQKDEAQMASASADLCELAECDLSSGAGHAELTMFQRVMPPGVQIIVFDDLSGTSVYFKGEVIDVEHRISLLLYQGHFKVIKSVCCAFAFSYYCHACNIGYAVKDRHICLNSCGYCNSETVCLKEPVNLKCPICSRVFFNQNCYNHHTLIKVGKKQSMCDMFKRCEKCYRTYKISAHREHVCSEGWCKTCYDYMPYNHKCYMKRDKKQVPPSDDNVLYVFWDCESTLDTPVSEDPADGTKHVVNLIVAQTQCSACSGDEDISKLCSKCGVRNYIFIDNDPIKSFLDFLMLPRKIFKKLLLFAHNAKSYDNVLLLHHLLTKQRVVPKLIMRENQVISMIIGNLKFLDSMMFLPMALSKLPETLELGPGVAKGYCAYLFNTAKNMNYIGDIPAIEFFDIGSMNCKNREKFIMWHAQQVSQKVIYNHREALISYCIDDVSILRKSCMKFKELLMQEGNINPLLECISLASSCSLIFRRNYLTDFTLGILPITNYRMSNQQSKIAIQWLLWEERERNVKIVHTGNSKEHRLPNGLFVDGYYEKDGQKNVLSFAGCAFHACIKCYPHDSTPLFNDPNDNMGLRRERSVAQIKALKEQGYIVTEKRECEFRSEIKLNPVLRAYVQNHAMLREPPLDPRSSLQGGRVEVFRQYHKCENVGETIEFVDYVSLYAYILKHGKIPLGHPVITTGPDFPDINTCNGLIKCSVLPPSSLMLPILPIKVHDRLMFVLCMKCAEQLINADCPHEDAEERAIKGVWVADELRLAIENGYRILKIFEVWEYQVSQFNPETKIGGIFVEYVNKFMKIKTEASGFPLNCNTLEEKQNYIQEYFETENIMLDINNIKVNPGLRYIGKTLINSLWGRFAMCIQRNQCMILNEPQKLYQMLCNPNYDIKSITCIGEESVVVNYEIFNELSAPDPTVNVVIASYITSFARIRLYSGMKELQNRILYSDTDSYSYVANSQEEKLPTADKLGMLQNELDKFGVGATISEFVAGASKNYAYKVCDATKQHLETVMKVKGISLNYRNSEVVNFETLKRMILTDPTPVYTHDPHKIQKTKEFGIISKPQSKIYRAQNLKRRLLPNSHQTVPWGYKHDTP